MVGVVIFVSMIIIKNVHYLFLRNIQGACSPYFLLCFNFVLFFFFALQCWLSLFLCLVHCCCTWCYDFCTSDHHQQCLLLASSQFSRGSFFIFWFCFALPFCFCYVMIWSFSIFLVDKLLFWFVFRFCLHLSLFTSMSPTWIMPFSSASAFFAYIVLTRCLFLHLTLVITTSRWREICFRIVPASLSCFYFHLSFFLHRFVFFCVLLCY